MEDLKSSPARFSTCLQDQLQNSVERISIKMNLCDKQRQLEALNLSARKIINKTKTLESKKVARRLFENSLKGSNIRDLLHDNIKTTLKVIENVASPMSPITNKRKYSNILNENRGNYEAVDVSVDLCSSTKDDSVQQHKKFRTSV